MDDVHVRAREERERLEDLLRKLADEVERDPVELRVLQEFVKIVAARARPPRAVSSTSRERAAKLDPLPSPRRPARPRAPTYESISKTRHWWFRY